MADCLALLRSLDFFGAVSCPYTNAIGNAFFGVVMMLVLLMVYERTRDVTLPAILGLVYGLVGATLVVPEFRNFYYVIIVLAITAIIYRMFKRDV